MKNQQRTPASTTRLPKYRPQDQPTAEAISGVRVGAMSPPTLQPVFMMPLAAPTSFPPRSIAVAQKEPSEAEANPSARERRTATLSVPVRLTPMHNRDRKSTR